MKISETKKGDLAILTSAILWAIFPIITVLSYSSLGPLTSLAFSTLFATVFFAGVLSYQKKWHELARRDAWLDIAFIALFIGILFYTFFFLGLKYTSPGNASLVALLEILFSYLLFNVWRKEEFSLTHIAGALLMITGAATILFPKTSGFQKGDLLIIIATMVAPFGNLFQQRARKKISSEAIMFGRSALTTPFVFGLAWLFTEHLTALDIKKSIVLLLVNGFVLFGLTKILWLEGIHRISVTKANALSSVSPLLTILFAYWILKQPPQLSQLLAFLPLCAGLILLTRREKIS